VSLDTSGGGRALARGPAPVGTPGGRSVIRE
jgi:hypothetical protein